MQYICQSLDKQEKSMKTGSGELEQKLNFTSKLKIVRWLVLTTNPVSGVKSQVDKLTKGKTRTHHLLLNAELRYILTIFFVLLVNTNTANTGQIVYSFDSTQFDDPRSSFDHKSNLGFVAHKIMNKNNYLSFIRIINIVNYQSTRVQYTQIHNSEL